MYSIFRLILRLFLLVFVTLYHSLVMIGVVLRYRKRIALRLVHRGKVMKSWANRVLRILGAKITVEGEPPSRPFLMVTNHLSYLDVILLASVVDTAFISKSEVASWPFIGRVSRLGDTIFIDRTLRRDVVRVAQHIHQRYDEGWGMTFFPEGTSSPGAELLPFRASLFAPAAKEKIPVHAACLSYKTSAPDPPAHLAICWWGGMLFGSHVLGLLRLQGFECKMTFGSRPVVTGDRKLLAEQLRTEIESIFTATVQPSEIDLN